mgnify:CR=1 FL=1
MDGLLDPDGSDGGLVMSVDYDKNKPVGATKEMVVVHPMMEMFNKYHKQNLQCSIDEGAPPVPFGAREYFDRHGYMIIKNLYDPKKLYRPVPQERGQITYWGKRLDEFIYQEEEQQVNGSIATYTHPQYREAHNQVRFILEDILGEKLYNTYYYDRYYFKGQRLVRHRDRDACEISVSIQISSNRESPWSFGIETPNGKELACNLQDGWGLLYKGCERDHWREPLESRYVRKRDKLRRWLSYRDNDDTYHHQIFFHYVRANGPRAHCAWDKTR